MTDAAKSFPGPLVSEPARMVGWIILCTLGVISCKNGELIQPPLEAHGYFPDAVGDRWEYAVYDSVSRAADTVLVSVMVSLSRFLCVSIEPANLWQTSFRTHSDTQYVRFHHDSVYIGCFTPDYIIPFQVGDRWGYDYRLGGDSTSVKAADSLTVAAGHFGTAFFLYRHRYTFGPVQWWDTKTWFVPSVGIVRVQEMDMNRMNRTWELLSYKFTLPEPGAANKGIGSSHRPGLRH